MLTDHERAALERLRLNASPNCPKSGPDHPYSQYYTHFDRNLYHHDLETLARIALRDHPPDDDKPVTLEWALSSVQSDRNCGPYGGGVQLWSGPNSWAAVPLDATRGDFRALCRIMGIELKEQA